VSVHRKQTGWAVLLLAALTACGPAQDPLPPAGTGIPTAGTEVPSTVSPSTEDCLDQAAIDVGAPLVPAAPPQDDVDSDVPQNDLEDPGTDAGHQAGC